MLVERCACQLRADSLALKKYAAENNRLIKSIFL